MVEDIGAAQPRSELEGIHGWLLLPAILFVLGLITGPILLILGLFSLPRVPLAFGLTSFSVSLLSYIWLCYVARLFFTKRRSARIAIIFYLLALIPLDLILAGVSGAMLEQLSPQVPQDNRTRLITHFLAAAILVPYFARSKRVKATFREVHIEKEIRPLRPLDPRDGPPNNPQRG